MLFLPCSDLLSIVNISSKGGHLFQRQCCLYTASDRLKCVTIFGWGHKVLYSDCGAVNQYWCGGGTSSEIRKGYLPFFSRHSDVRLQAWQPGYPFFIPRYTMTKFRVTTQTCRRNRHGLNTSKTKYWVSNATQNINFLVRDHNKKGTVLAIHKGTWEMEA